MVQLTFCYQRGIIGYYSRVIDSLGDFDFFVCLGVSFFGYDDMSIIYFRFFEEENVLRRVRVEERI